MMYNRYLNSAGRDEAEPTAEFDDNFKSEFEQNNKTFEQEGIFSALKNRMGKIKLDTDTIILIAIIWFILQENGETDIDKELLIVLGILLFMGL